jgi:hypothetical protein
MTSFKEIKRISDEILTLSTTDEAKKLIHSQLGQRFRLIA